jgi:hypothetical protein
MDSKIFVMDILVYHGVLTLVYRGTLFYLPETEIIACKIPYPLAYFGKPL